MIAGKDIIYVSQSKGNDTPSCGEASIPCKTIVFGVWRSKQDALVYVDGTGSETTPYSCKSPELKFPGIQSNKSLEIIGVKSMVHVKCHPGYHITLDNSHNNQTFFSVRNIKFINTTIQGRDIYLYIKDCIFTDGSQAVNIMQSTWPITMSFTRSLCVNMTSCIAVSVTTNNISIYVENSAVVQSQWHYNPTSAHEKASGIHVMSTGQFATGSITCHIALKNVTFKDNFLGSNGLIFVNVDGAMTSITFEKVLFLVNYFEGILTSLKRINLINVLSSYDLYMSLNNTTFDQNFHFVNRALEVVVKNSITLSIIKSRFSNFTAKRGEPVSNIMSLTSNKDTTLYIQNTTFENNWSQSIGGCISMNSETAAITLKDSSFLNNHAGNCAGIMWLDVKHQVNLEIEGCLFKSNTVKGPGSLASFKTSNVNVKVVDSIINGVIGTGPGGVLDMMTGCSTSSEHVPPVQHLSILFDGITITGCSIYGPGGVIAMNAVNSSILIRETIVQDISSTGPGGLIYAQNGLSKLSSPEMQHGEMRLNLENVLIDSVSVHAPGGAVNIEQSPINAVLKLNNSLFKSCHALGGPGGVLYLNTKSIARIYNCVFESNTAAAPGGAIYSGNSLTLDIVGSVFKLNTARAPGGAIHSGGSLKLTITNSLFKLNTALGSVGGAISASTVSTCHINNSIFVSNRALTPGGSIYLELDNADVFMYNVTFRNCSSLTALGGAIYFYGTRGDILLKSCTFLSNTAPRSIGEAIAVDLSNNDDIIDPGCRDDAIQYDDVRHRIWSYNTSMTISDSTFINNTAMSGGALSLSRGNHTILRCSFLDNFANLQGGHVYMVSDSTSLQLIDSNLIQRNPDITIYDLPKKVTFGSANGLFVNSQSMGPLTILNSTLSCNIPWQQGTKSLVTVSKGNYVNFGDNNLTVLTCPRGNKLDILNFTTEINTEYHNKKCKIALIVLQVTCIPCGTGTYSLQHGQSLGMNPVKGFRCLKCPFGADCSRTIIAKSNFWGFKVLDNPVELNFTLCPSGYCKKPDQRQSIVSFNSCHGNRTGSLCGKCKKSYSETLLSPSCRHDDECHDKWLWAVFVVMVTSMACYLIHKPAISRMFRSQVLWFLYRGNKDCPYYHNTGGYLKIVFYFYQVANLLLVTTSYDSLMESYLLQPVVGIFNFQLRFSSNGFLCPFPGLNAVNKQLLFASPVFGVLIMVALCYCCHCLIHKCISKPSPNAGPYLGATLETLLLGYAVFAYTALQLLRCPTLGDESRLFIDGNVACYQGWQFALMVFVGVVVFPFILALALGSHWLYNEAISVKEFLFGCVLPLPYLVCKLILFFCHEPRQPGQEPVEWRTAVTSVLYGPFRSPQDNYNYGALYWESILISRRLVIILIFVFVTDPLSRAFLLTLACVAVLFHHTVMQPFNSKAANITEMISLLSLVVIAAINTFKASFLSTDQTPEGPLKSFANAVDWVQIFILVLAPVLCFLAVVAAIVSLAIRVILLVIKCQCGWTGGGSRHLLEDTTNLIQDRAAT